VIAVLVPAIDIYLTYRCNLRCTHCFVGDHLNQNSEFSIEALLSLISSCQQWGTNKLTFLGGEPTLYPSLVQVVKFAHAGGLKTRIITNGQGGFRRFTDSYDGETLPSIGFSIDGATKQTHESIRGLGTFERLIDNINRSQSFGYRTHAVVSISRQNSHELTEILDVCDRLKFRYVNVHYVTSRGFASPDIVLSVDEWENICRRAREHSQHLRTEIRLEETFSPLGTRVASCAVRNKSSLLFFPDGRVFMCPMFIDMPNAHSFMWSDLGLLPNSADGSEQNVCKKDTSVMCPAMQFVNPAIAEEASKKGYLIRCIFDKTQIGLVKRMAAKSA
jgi:MoaA/NifB/PqqE/SkfB family radical SAM enzyme